MSEVSIEGPWTYGDLTVTCDREVSPEIGARFWPLYLAAFEPLATLAAARQVLSREEFDAEIADPRIWKYIAWNAEGEPVAMGTGTADLEAVPWVSPEFWLTRYPDHAARGALLYLGFSLVHPDHRTQRVYLGLLKSMLARCAALGAVVGWDICSYNDTERLFGLGLARLSQRIAGATVDTVDVQTYYAASFPVPNASVEREA